MIEDEERESGATADYNWKVVRAGGPRVEDYPSATFLDAAAKPRKRKRKDMEREIGERKEEAAESQRQADYLHRRLNDAEARLRATMSLLDAEKTRTGTLLGIIIKAMKEG